MVLVALIVSLAAFGSVEAQPSGKVPRIGYLTGTGGPDDPGPFFEAFRQGLRTQGYIEGKNILIEHRYVKEQVEQIPTMVSELVQLKLDALVLGQLQAIRAAKDQTTTIPIVMITTVDPVTSGLVKSFSRPGSNVTGVALLTRELNGKRLELLKEVAPRVSSVAVLFGDSSNARTRFNEYEAAGKVLRLHLRPVELKAPEPDFASALQIVAKTGSDGILAIPNSLVNRFTKEIAEIGLKTRLPSITERNDYVEAGSLLSYSASSAEVYRRAAYYVDKILKGVKPAELPVEQPTKFELVINLKTAKQIGLTIPPNVLARADRVIR